jgi:[acyl-carrier-protein] S-malonyltransferase
MGRDVYDAWDTARAVFAEISQAAGFDVAAVCFDPGRHALESTAVAQPALLAAELSCASVLRRADLSPAACAGHSLGEFAAWVESGAMTRAQVARLVAVRGRLMEDAAQHRPGAMAAVLGLDQPSVQALCREASAAGMVVAANFNCPDQVVISGEKQAVAAAVRLARERGARARMLNVAGAFHSPLMREAAERFAEALGEVKAFDPVVPVTANASGDWAPSAEAVKAAAAAQMTSPVRWESCMRKLLASGVRRFYEVGPGNVLAGLLRRIDPAAEVIAAGDADALRRIVERANG